MKIHQKENENAPYHYQNEIIRFYTSLSVDNTETNYSKDYQEFCSQQYLQSRTSAVVARGYVLKLTSGVVLEHPTLEVVRLLLA